MARPTGRTLAPLTPRLDYALPSKPTVVPDVRSEEILFKLYLEQKALAEYWKHQAQKRESIICSFKARGYSRKVAASLKPKESR